MKSIEKFLGMSSVVVLVAGMVRCSNPTTNPQPDMAMTQLDMSVLSAPTVTSVTPTTAFNSEMTMLTLTGTNFQAGTTVTVGGVGCTQVTVLWPTQLNCMYPGAPMTCGGQMIRATNPGDLNGGTLAAAMGLYLNSEEMFAPATVIPAGPSPHGIAGGDVNGDGKLDLAVANDPNNVVSVLLGDGMGGFAPPNNFPTDGAATSVAMADFNGDQRLDLVVSNRTSNNVSVLLGDGKGGLYHLVQCQKKSIFARMFWLSTFETTSIKTIR